MNATVDFSSKYLFTAVNYCICVNVLFEFDVAVIIIRSLRG